MSKTTLPRTLRKILSLNDFENLARNKLPRPLFSYINNGTEEEESLAYNRTIFNEYSLIPRVLVGVSKRTQKIAIFGREYDSPFGISPVGLSALYAYRGDLLLARSGAQSNIPVIMSGTSLIPMEELAIQAPNTWFQAYMPGEEDRVDALLLRVKNAGFKTLVLTVDVPVPTNPENYVRHGFSAPLRPSLNVALQGVLHPGWLLGTFFKTLIRHGLPHFENLRAERGAPIISRKVERDFGARDHLNWNHVTRIRDKWQGTLVVKGVMRWQDAIHAQNAGVDGIIVSNHGGRQLDGAVAPLQVLAEIVKAAPNLVVMMDGGIRRGSDVIKALSFGARCVFAGRPFNYAASVGGAAAIDHAINILRSEIHRNMALLGVNHIEEIDQTFICRKSGSGVAYNDAGVNI